MPTTGGQAFAARTCAPATGAPGAPTQGTLGRWQSAPNMIVGALCPARSCRAIRQAGRVQIGAVAQNSGGGKGRDERLRRPCLCLVPRSAPLNSVPKRSCPAVNPAYRARLHGGGALLVWGAKAPQTSFLSVAPPPPLSITLLPSPRPGGSVALGEVPHIVRSKWAAERQPER